jgi:hypothetical protein
MERGGSRWSRIRDDGFYCRRFKFNILLGSFCTEIFFRPAPERQEAAKNPVGLEVESGLVAAQGVAFGGGFEG